MADISKLKIKETTYNIKDSTARLELETKVSEAPFDGAEYVRKNGSWALSSGAGGAGATSAIYFYQQTVNVANNAEILRITDSSITPYVVVLECTFANPSYITSDITWTSYDGYISFTGTCTVATTANVTLGILADGKVNKSGDIMTGALLLNKGATSFDIVNINNSKLLTFKSTTTDGVQYIRLGLRDDKAVTYPNRFQVWYDNKGTNKGATIYTLPEWDPSIEENKYYNILTSKNPVTITQGGTGANSRTTAVSNLFNSHITSPTGIMVGYNGGENYGWSSTTEILTAIKALPLTGGELTGHLHINNSKRVYFHSTTTNGLTTAMLYLRQKDEDNGNRLSFWYSNPSGSGATLYSLPEADESVATNTYYQILTDKGTTILKNDTQLVSPHASSTYWSGRDNAPFVVNGNTGNNNYYPALSIKAKTSSWEIGTNGADEYLQFSNVSDANHSTSTNTLTGYFRIKPNGYLNQPSLNLESTGETVFKVYNTSITLGTAPSSDSWLGGFAIYATDVNVGYLESRYDTSRNSKLRLLCRNKTNGDGSNLDNYIELIMSNSGSASIYLSHPQAWVKELFASNLTSTAKHLVGITSSYADSGYITLPLPVALGGIGGTDSGWKSCNVSAFASSGAIKYRKIGFLLCVYLENLKLTSSITAGGYLDCGAIIPDGYRPAHDLYLSCFINTNSVNVRNIPCRITQSGVIYLYANKEEATPSGQNILGSGVGFI